MSLIPAYIQRITIMNSPNWLKQLTVVSMLALAVPAIGAQKGMGDRTGIAREGASPEVVALTGRLLNVDTHRCEKTTGPAALGTHLIVRMTNGEKINLHLGPSSAVDRLVTGLKPGMSLRVKAFRTDDMEKNAYVAVTLTGPKKTVTLRDGETLRPVWAGGRRGGKQLRRGRR